MQFIDIPTEQTTAVTDLLLAIFSIWAILTIRKSGKNDPKKARIWTWVFILLTIAALFGAVAHGFQMDSDINFILWQPLNLALGLAVSLFAAGAIYDMRHGSIPAMVIPGLIALGIIFYFITVFFPGSFLVFIIYEAIVMIFALVAYILLASKGVLKGAWWMVGGILITIVAAVIQADGSLHLTLIWEFDFNGIFHLVQIVGIVVLVQGLIIDFKLKDGITQS